MTFQEYRKVYLSPEALYFSVLKMYINFCWYFVPIGIIPFLFAGFKWNKNNLSLGAIVLFLLLASIGLFIPCMVTCYLVHFRRLKDKTLGSIGNISAKEAGVEVANIFP